MCARGRLLGRRDDLLVRVDVDAPVRALARAQHADVQFSSISAMTPRLRGGSSGLTSGYCSVTDRLVIDLKVTPKPLTRPTPRPGSSGARSPCDHHHPGQQQLHQRHRNQALPGQRCSWSARSRG